MRLIISTALCIFMFVIWADYRVNRTLYTYHTDTITIPDHPLTVIESRIRDNIELLNYPISDQRKEWFVLEIAWASYVHAVPDDILLALIATESSFNINAVSHAGAIGPAQVLPSYWNHLHYNIHNPSENILAGAYILKEYKEKCGTWKCALMSYNIGITNFRKGKNKPAALRYYTKIKKKLKLLT